MLPQPANPMVMVTPGQQNNNMNNQYIYPPGGNPNPNAFAPQNMMYLRRKKIILSQTLKTNNNKFIKRNQIIYLEAIKVHQ
jgi:hypothetical protein